MFSFLIMGLHELSAFNPTRVGLFRVPQSAHRSPANDTIYNIQQMSTSAKMRIWKNTKKVNNLGKLSLIGTEIHSEERYHANILPHQVVHNLAIF